MFESGVRQEFNIYCDESCHLENDGQKAMALGGIWCPKAKARSFNEAIRALKEKHDLSRDYEIKFHKVSMHKIAFFIELLDLFFDNADLHFRCLVIPDKSILNHDKFNHSHDDFYYKMYFDMLKVILDPSACYNIYLDIKDTRSQGKVDKLTDVLRNNHYDFEREIIKKIQQAHSHEIELLQLTDLITGALSYLHRGINTSEAKLLLIKHIQTRSGYPLKHSTLYRESKMNIFIWKPRSEL
jgi:hypothetical protein